MSENSEILSKKLYNRKWVNISLFGPYRDSCFSGEGNKFVFSSKFEDQYTMFANFNYNLKKWELEDHKIDFTGLVKLSYDGSTLIIGNKEENKVKVFRLIEDKWTQVGLDFIGDNGSNFGCSIAISFDGSRIAIGSKYDSNSYNNNGSVSIFELRDSNWFRLGEKLEGETNNEELGLSIDINSDLSRLIIGSNSNIVRTYGYNGKLWVKNLNDINGVNGSNFGHSVSMNEIGDLIAIGSPGSSDTDTSSPRGDVYIYKIVDGNWELTKRINNDNSEGFGSCIRLNENSDKIFISAKKSSKGKGKVFFYKKSSNDWVEFAESLEGENEGNEFGTNISINGSGELLSVGGRIGANIYFPSVNSKLKIFKLIKNVEIISPPAPPIPEQTNRDIAPEESIEPEVVEEEDQEYNDESDTITETTDKKWYEEIIEKIKNNRDYQVLAGLGILFLILFFILLSKNSASGTGDLEVFDTHPPVV
tara:strand:+ start:1889 stop:3316 length:1428 start_codon:yes stop_codon:yes gene_type:complete